MSPLKKLNNLTQRRKERKDYLHLKKLNNLTQRRKERKDFLHY